MSEPASPASNPYAPPKAAVADAVENSVGSLATRMSRLKAAIIDTVLFGLAVAPLTFVYTKLTAMGADGTEGALGTTEIGAMLISAVALIVLTVLNIRYVQANGQSIGKRFVDIKVVRKNGSRASLARIFWLRNVVNSIPGLLPFVGNFYALVDCLVIFRDDQRCIHDHIADTIVINA